MSGETSFRRVSRFVGDELPGLTGIPAPLPCRLITEQDVSGAKSLCFNQFEFKSLLQSYEYGFAVTQDDGIQND